MKTTAMKHIIAIFAALLLTPLSALHAAEGKPDNPVVHCAVSTKPLRDWKSSFLTGNGNMGVIMPGEPYAETLIINGKLYLPLGSKEILPDLAAFKDEFKKVGLDAGKDGPATVHKLMVKKSGQKLIDTDPLHPAFLLRLTMKGTPGAVRNYRMTEDFTTGELQVRWSDAQGDWCRKLFVSRPDEVIVMSINGPKGKVDCDVAMEVKHPLVKSELTVEDDWLAAHNIYLKGKGGYDNLIRVVPTGGRMWRQEDRLSITEADSILLIMQVKKWKTPLPKEQSEAWAFSPEHPDFRGAYTTNRLAEMKETLGRLRPEYTHLFLPQAKAHGALYNRVCLDLGGGDDRRLTSEELLARAAKDGTMSKALAERLYNACRYLIICSSGDTPPNLQGIWTGTWSPAWSGDYTLDSNLQLEIQSMMSCNMPELMESYFNLVDSWVPDWRLNAKKIFGFRGVASDVRGSTSCLLQRWGGWPGEQAAIGIAGWLLHFYYDYYQFTGDRKFLTQRFVPLAKEIALFYEDFLAGTEDANGKYRFYMGYSPEHGLRSPNTTYDIAIAKNVFTTLIAACKELGIERENLPKWQAMLAKMPPYLINNARELQEWSWPDIAEDPNHRHHSQFLPLYQFCEFDRDTTPALWKAADLAFDQKVKQWLRGPKPGSNNTTHGMMNQGQCAARLGRSDVVYEVISRMITRRYLHPNFMMGYWPRQSGFGFDPAGAIPDVLNNALIFAWNGTIDVLPALPKEWPTGSIRGILLRGQIQVQQLAWDIPARKINLTLSSDKNQIVTLRFPPGLRISSAPPNCHKLTLTKGKPAHFEITIPATETSQ